MNLDKTYLLEFLPAIIVQMAANRSQAPKAKNGSPFTFNGDPLPIRRRDTDEPVNGTVEFTAWALAQLEASWGGKTLSLALQKKVGLNSIQHRPVLFNFVQFYATPHNSTQPPCPTLPTLNSFLTMSTPFGFTIMC